MTPAADLKNSTNNMENCDSKKQWSELGAIIEGHEFEEVNQPDKTKQILKCKICGYESVGVIK